MKTHDRTGKAQIDGVLLLDKPRGITSQAAVTRLKMLLKTRKAGHTGTLDPLADGLLPVCFGEATKFSQLLLDADKEYVAVIRLGTRTTTGDLEGAAVEERACITGEVQIHAVLQQFIGEIEQIPPMYSALKRDGRPLYDYARAGEHVSRAPRRIQIRRLQLERCGTDELQIRVTCSKGTYIRVLAEDIGHALGGVACLASLTRTAVGRFSLSQAATFGELEKISLADRWNRLLAVDSLVETLPRVDLDATGAMRIRMGQPVEAPAAAGLGLARLYGPGSEFLGVAEAGDGGRVVAKRLMATGDPRPEPTNA